MSKNERYKWPQFSFKEINAVKKVISSGKVNYLTGEEGKKFESEYARWCGTKYAIALANGTLALEVALKSINIKKGDEVIVTPRSFIASVSCVINMGGIPKFADVDENSGNITTHTIRKLISSKTKAIICVHLGGLPCEMDGITTLAKKNNLYLIEDCSQAHGASYKGKKVGSIGHIGTWSFCQDKIISTGGEGGMITTNNRSLYEKIWSLKDHGKNRKKLNNPKPRNEFVWLHDQFGSNYRMTEMQAAIGRIQLRKIDTTSRIRNRNARCLINIFKKYPEIFTLQNVDNHMKHAYYKFYVYLKQKKGLSRAKIISEFRKSKIECFSGSCSEIYLEKAFDNKKYKPKKRLTNAKQIGETSIVFLVHQTINKNHIDQICKKIDKIIKTKLIN